MRGSWAALGLAVGGDDAVDQDAEVLDLGADHVAWLQAHAGERVGAPKALGSRAHKAIAKAPGTYVLAA